jgi:hypothetical protein
MEIREFIIVDIEYCYSDCYSSRVFIGSAAVEEVKELIKQELIDENKRMKSFPEKYTIDNYMVEGSTWEAKFDDFIKSDYYIYSAMKCEDIITYGRIRIELEKKGSGYEYELNQKTHSL